MEAYLKIKVRFFALYRERAGMAESVHTIPAGSSLHHLITLIRQRHPNLAPSETAIVAAVNTEYAQDDTILYDGDVVALIPPVSGGNRD